VWECVGTTPTPVPCEDRAAPPVPISGRRDAASSDRPRRPIAKIGRRPLYRSVGGATQQAPAVPPEDREPPGVPIPGSNQPPIPHHGEYHNDNRYRYRYHHHQHLHLHLHHLHRLWALPRNRQISGFSCTSQPADRARARGARAGHWPLERVSVHDQGPNQGQTR